MSEIVFILGAGASKSSGAPLMNDFIDRAELLMKTGQVGRYEDDFQTVFSAISKLQTVHSKSTLNLDNIESIYATFEMGLLIDKFLDYSHDDIDSLIRSLRKVIVVTIEKSMPFPTNSQNDVEPQRDYQLFAETLNTYINERNTTCSVITFNYDLGVDFALYHNGVPYNYYIADEGEKDSIPLLKLHGSINWTRCKECKRILIWDFEDYISKNPPKYEDEKYEMSLGTLLSMSDLNCCSHETPADPIIIPPTFNKTSQQNDISSVWKRAAEEISEAEYIFIIGYSLTETDSFFRYLYALGSIGKVRVKKFCVVNPDGSGVTEERFRKLIGQGIQQRFEYLETDFHTFFKNNYISYRVHIG